MAQAAQAVKFARAYLNDINGTTWTDPVLMSFLQIAHSELVQRLELNRTGVMKVQSPIITVPRGSVTLGYSQPSNIINPISMMEGQVGDDPDNFEDMVKVTFIPFIDQDTELTYWAWIGQNITFLGSTQDRDVILRYDGALQVPQRLTDQLGCIFAENYIGPRIVALAFTAIGKDNQRILDLAEKNLYRLIQSQVTNDQRPTRRRGYRSPKSGCGTSSSASVPIFGTSGLPVGGAVSQWIPALFRMVISGSQALTFDEMPGTFDATSGTFDEAALSGVFTVFAFPQVPRFISWNGVNQYLNQGYKIFAAPNNVLITFIDVNGMALTPGPTDTIVAISGAVQTAPLTAINGVNQTFVFSFIPQYIIWNGVNQFLGTGYKQSVVNDTLVYFIDVNGVTLTPGLQDDIREAV